MRIFLNLFAFLFLPSSAFAHLGHLGEIAGHSHWIALGAGAVAIAIAGLVAKSKDTEETSEDEVESEQEPELEGAAS